MDDAIRLKDSFMHDTRRWYAFEPCRDKDICSFMRQYLYEASHEGRPEVLDGILKNIGRWMRNEPYSSPYIWGKTYSPSVVDDLEKVINTYMENIQMGGDLIKCADDLREAIRQIDDENDGRIMDTWRQDMLDEFLDMTAGLSQDQERNIKPVAGPAMSQQMGGM